MTSRADRKHREQDNFSASMLSYIATRKTFPATVVWCSSSGSSAKRNVLNQPHLVIVRDSPIMVW